MSAPQASTASPGRTWTARVLLLLGIIWAAAKVVEVASSGGGFALEQALDITNPSLLGILGVGGFVAYFFVRPANVQAHTAPVEHAPASKTMCDQCGRSFPSSYYLAKSPDNRYLCEACRAAPGGA